MKQDFKLNKNTLDIYFLSDLHLGSPNCNREYFEYWKSVFEESSNKKKVLYLLGDLIDMQSLRIGAWDTDLTADEQILRIEDELRPYRKYIRYSVSGNHSNRVKKDFNMDIGNLISENLDIPYHSADFFDTLYINGNEFTIYGMHGKRFSKSKQLAQKNFEDDMRGKYKANLMVMGHNHYNGYWSSPYRTREGIERTHYGFSGHFLSYSNGYAHKSHMPYSPEGFIKYTLDKDCVLNCETFDIDTRRKDLMRMIDYDGL